MNRIGLAALALLALGAFGCPAPKRTAIQMEPLLIEVNGEGEPYRVFTPRDLLREANDIEDCLSALPRYERLADEFPDSPQALDALYNSGICYELGERWSDARDKYDAVIASAGDDAAISIDASLRKAYCLEKLGRHRTAARIYKQLARERAVPPDLRAGAALRRGLALVASGKPRKGERLLNRALVRTEKLQPPPGPDVRAAAAEAAFVRAEIARADFESLPLQMPAEQLAGDLQAKGAALQIARDRFVAVMRWRDALWAARAGVRVGQLYETLHDDLHTLPEPDLPAGALDIYRAETTRRLAPLRQHAFQAYLQVLLLAERVGLETEAVAMARHRVTELEPLLKEQVLPDRRIFMPEPIEEPVETPPGTPGGDAEDGSGDAEAPTGDPEDAPAPTPE